MLNLSGPHGMSIYKHAGTTRQVCISMPACMGMCMGACIHAHHVSCASPSRMHAHSGHGGTLAAGDADGEITCGTCFCEVPCEEATRMECGHAFCNDCWRQHLRIQIQEGRSRRLPCMGVRCGVICDEGQVPPPFRHTRLLPRMLLQTQNLSRACPLST